MELRDWMHFNKVSNMAMSHLLDCDCSQVSGWRSGRMIPCKDYLKKVYLVTGGFVTPSDFYPIDEWKKELE